MTSKSQTPGDVRGLGSHHVDPPQMILMNFWTLFCYFSVSSELLDSPLSTKTPTVSSSGFSVPLGAFVWKRQKIVCVRAEKQ